MTDQAARPSLDPIQIERRLNELDRHIVRVEALRPHEVLAESAPAVTVLQAAIRETLVSCFGQNTASYRHFEAAGYLYVDVEAPGFFNRNAMLQNSRREARNTIDRTLGLLREAQEVLRGDLAEARKRFDRAAQTDLRPVPLSRRVFVVHGHDDGAREAVARFLEKIDFEPVILHEQANQGRTIIEKFEAHGDVGFAVVLLTPDDEGCAKGGKIQPRARQNVVLELGYFIGRLGRNKVCALKRGDLEIPSDYQGVLWESLDAGGGWKLSLVRNLKGAGHEVDLNNAY